MSAGRVATVAKPHELDITDAEVPEPAPRGVVVNDVAPLITGTVGLDGLAEVLTDLASANTSHANVLVDPER